MSDTGSLIAVDSWDDSLDVELKFRLIGKYQSKSSAIEDLENGLAPISPDTQAVAV